MAKMVIAVRPGNDGELVITVQDDETGEQYDDPYIKVCYDDFKAWDFIDEALPIDEDKIIEHIEDYEQIYEP